MISCCNETQWARSLVLLCFVLLMLVGGCVAPSLSLSITRHRMEIQFVMQAHELEAYASIRFNSLK
jgi:hypothetical protein